MLGLLWIGLSTAAWAEPPSEGGSLPGQALTSSSWQDWLESLQSLPDALSPQEQLAACREGGPLLLAAEEGASPELIEALEMVTLCLSHLGALSEAIRLGEHALQRIEEAGGVYSGSALTLHNQLGSVRFEEGDLQGALQHFQRAYELLQSQDSADGPQRASVLNNLGFLYSNLGDYERALPLLQESSELVREKQGEEHIHYALSLNNLAEIHHIMGEYSEAAEAYQHARLITRLAVGAEHPHYAMILNDLGLLMDDMGQPDKALELLEEALEVRIEAQGLEHPEAIATLINLAQLRGTLGHYHLALPLYQRLLPLLEGGTIRDPLLHASALNNLAMLYRSLGLWEDAAELFEGSLMQLRGLYGDQHPKVARGLQNLVSVSATLGELERALELHAEAGVILRAQFDPGHPLLASHALQGAWLSIQSEDWPAAMAQARTAERLLGAQFGPQHPRLAEVYGCLAEIQQRQGDHRAALASLEREQAVQARVYGEDHTITALITHRMAWLYHELGEAEEAESALRESLRVYEGDRVERLALGSPALNRRVMRKATTVWQQVLTLHLMRQPDSPELAQLALESILQHKTRALEAEVDRRFQLHADMDASTSELLQQLSSVSNQLERMVREASMDLESLSPADREALGTLQRQEVELKAQLTRLSQEFATATEPITAERVRASLPEQGALLEWVRWTPRTPDSAQAEPRYAVYVLSSEGVIGWHDLGEAAPLEARIRKLRGDLLRESRIGYQDWGPALTEGAEALYQELFAPLEDALEGLQHLYLSPDAELALVPFELLRRPDGQLLDETFLLTRLSSGRDLLRIRGNSTSSAPPVILAGIDFGEPGSLESEEGAREGRSAASGRFPPLAGSVLEGQQLEQLLGESLLLSGSQATEARVKALSAPSILHIATHGYFSPELAPARAQDGPLTMTRLEASQADGLLQSGIVLAGVNSGGQGEDNGYLSAAELIHMDLRGTELVVLSACETAVGEVQEGEGVQGLAKALQVAGSETQVLSLWKVSDEATQILMQEFYTRLLDGEGRGEALRQAKAALRENPRFAHPYYWAAFVLSGDWRPLDTELSRPRWWERWRAERSRKG